MIDVAIGRMLIACRADRRRKGEALAVRARLERVARHKLPSALDRALSGRAGSTVDRVSVTLDFDPAVYDDDTVAVLWANRIRNELAAEPRPGSSQGRSGPAGDTRLGVADDSEPSEAIAHVSIGADDLGELVARALGGSPEALVAVADVAHRQDLLDRVVRELGSAEVDALAGRLEELAARLEAGHGAAALPPGATAPARPRRALADERTGDDPRAGGAKSVDAVAARDLRDAVKRLSRVRARASDGGRESSDEGAAGEPTFLTAVAGLVLLYPWLERYLTEATEADAHNDPSAARRVALARAVPELPDAHADPLVRLLAGEDPGTHPQSPPYPPHPERLDQAAASLLRSFASTLPGFERSSLEFVRHEFIVRTGRLELDADGGTLGLAPLPLDPVLSRLPYPLGPIEVASVHLVVRLEPR